MPAEEGETSKKIFIGGLSFETTDETLRNYFSKYGDITDSVVICEAGSRRPRGFGFVTYKELKSVDNCLACGTHQIDSKTVEVKRAVPRDSCELSAPNGQRSKKIFIGGLGASTTAQEIRNYFKQFGKVANIDLKKDRDTNVLRGFGFVVFEDEAAVDKALVSRYHDINGRKVEVKRAEPRSVLNAGNSMSIGNFAQSSSYERNFTSDGYGERGLLEGNVRDELNLPHHSDDHYNTLINGIGDFRYSPSIDDSYDELYGNQAGYIRASNNAYDRDHQSDVALKGKFPNRLINREIYRNDSDFYYEDNLSPNGLLKVYRPRMSQSYHGISNSFEERLYDQRRSNHRGYLIKPSCADVYSEKPSNFHYNSIVPLLRSDREELCVDNYSSHTGHKLESLVTHRHKGSRRLPSAHPNRAAFLTHKSFRGRVHPY